MRELRAVRVSDDGKEILLTETSGASASAGAAGEGDAPADAEYSLRADDRLRGMLRPRPITSESRPESALSPREIQSRLRAGETAEEVASAAGIPVARVARYEAPIAAERVRIVDEVRRATAPGPHRVSPGRFLGAVVDERLADDGLDPALAEWLARRQPDNTWMVTVDLADHHAEWSWDSAARRVRAHDSGAQRLLSPSRSSAESLIAVAQAAGVTAESPIPAELPDFLSQPVAPEDETPAPLAPARAVGESHGSEPDHTPGRGSSVRSGLVVLPGEATAAASTPRPQASASTTLDEVPGSGSVSAPPSPASKPTFTPSANDVPGSGPGDAEASSSPPSDEAVTEPAARPAQKSNRKRSAVPAWDDIVFGARRS